MLICVKYVSCCVYWSTGIGAYICLLGVMAFYRWCILTVIVLQHWECVFGSPDREPLCFSCSSVEHPNKCSSVHRCSPSEKCYTDHIIHSNGTTWYDLGCKPTEECSQIHTRASHGEARKFGLELELCDYCCGEDLCNSWDCSNGTNTEALRCLECDNVASPNECTTVRTCAVGEVCASQETTHIGVDSRKRYNLGCLSKTICSFLTPQLVGKRKMSSNGIRSTALCQKCCATDTCNIDLCQEDQTTSPPESSLGTEPSITSANNIGQTTTSSPPTAPSVSSTTTAQSTIPDSSQDCWTLKSKGFHTTGVYSIRAPTGSTVNVRCDMDTDGGGWTVIQRRVDGAISFFENWMAYKNGFGDLKGSFWKGNDLISALTNHKEQTLRVDLCSASGDHRYAIYRVFRVAGEGDMYRLHLEGYSGNAGDDMINNNSPSGSLQGKIFSTMDHQFGNGCPVQYHGGWWFNSCFNAFLNGVYGEPGRDNTRGVMWDSWLGVVSLAKAEMKIRPSLISTGVHHDDFNCVH